MNDADIDTFLQWFRSNGGVVDTKVVGITEFPGSGRGAIALRDIPEGYTLFTLPRTLTLSTRTSPLPALLGFDAWYAHQLHKGWVGLILCMMWEDAWTHELDEVGQELGGLRTKWGAYIRTLPEKFNTPMFWSTEELEELRGTSVVDKIGRNDAERDYSERLVPAIKTSPTLFPLSHHAKWYTLDAYHRAGSRILSRSFIVGRWTGDEEAGDNENREPDGDAGKSVVHEGEDSMGADDAQQHPSSPDDANEGLSSDPEDEEDDPSDVAMVPIADLLNARWGSENAKLFHEPLVLRMVTTRNIEQGEQIFNTYGDLPNSDLLRRYGHVDLVQIHPLIPAPTSDGPADVEMKDDTDPEAILRLGNPSDVLEVRADLVVHVVQTTNCGSKVKDVHARIEWWLDEGEDDVFVLSMPDPGSHLSLILSSSLISLTRLLILSESDFKSARSRGKLPKGKLKNGDKDDAIVLEVLDEVFKQREGMYAGGSVEDDERILSIPETLAERKRHAVIVRLGEKRILKVVRQALRMILVELRDAGGGGNEKGHARRDEKGGKGGKGAGSSGKRVIDGAEGGRGWKKPRK